MLPGRCPGRSLSPTPARRLTGARLHARQRNWTRLHNPIGPGATGDERPEVVITKGIDGPGSLAVDASGDLWAVNDGSGTVVEYSRADLAKPAPAPTVTLSIGGDGVAFDPSGDLWVANGSGVGEFTKAELAKSGAPTPVFTLEEGDCSVAFDASGDLWEGGTNNVLTEFTKAQLAQSAKSGSTSPAPKVAITSNSLDGPCKPAFDPAGDVWAGNYSAKTVVEFAKAQLGRTATLAPRVVISSFSYSSPGDVAVSRSGELWVPYFGGVSWAVAEFTKAQLGRSGSPTPAVTIAGPQTGLNSPWVVAIEP